MVGGKQERWGQKTASEDKMSKSWMTEPAQNRCDKGQDAEPPAGPALYPYTFSSGLDHLALKLEGNIFFVFFFLFVCLFFFFWSF